MSNVKFLLKALPKSDHVRELEAFAQNNQQTQGKKTIGNEKVSYLMWQHPTVILMYPRNIMCS